MRSFAFLFGVLAIAWMVAGCGGDDDDNPISPGIDNAVTLAVVRGSSGILENDQGVQLLISPGTVYTTSENEPGELLFSIEPVELTATVPTGFQLEGQIWQFGPEGITLAQRARISLPITDPAKSYVLGRLNRAVNAWQIVPTVFVPGTTDRVYADTKHFSAWALFSYDPESAEAPGVIHFQNTDATRWVSLCVRGYDLAHTSYTSIMDVSGVGTIISASGHTPGVASTADFIVPQGSWEFEMMRTVTVGSPWTADPDGWIISDPITVDTPGEGPTVTLDPSNWTDVNTVPTWAPCEGEPDFVFGTGSVQITLTWDDPVDLDLHVVEPSGEEIYYAHPVSATGGRLDRDTICESTTEGRPENIYWPGGAPTGAFQVKVHLFSVCSSGLERASFRLRTVVSGRVRTFTGSVAVDETVLVTTFTR